MKNKKRVKHYFIYDTHNSHKPLKTVCGFESLIFIGRASRYYVPKNITCKNCLKTKKYKTDAFNHLLGVTND